MCIKLRARSSPDKWITGYRFPMQLRRGVSTLSSNRNLISDLSADFRRKDPVATLISREIDLARSYDLGLSLTD